MIWGKSSSRNLSTILSAFELLSALAEYVCEMLDKARAWTVQKRTFDFSQKLIKTPSGDFEQVSEDF